MPRVRGRYARRASRVRGRYGRRPWTGRRYPRAARVNVGTIVLIVAVVLIVIILLDR
jgi:hypothetical protein